MKETREPFRGFVVIKNGTREQYDRAKIDGTIVFADIIDEEKTN